MQGRVVMSVVTYAELRAGLEIQSTHREQDERVLSPADKPHSGAAIHGG